MANQVSPAQGRELADPVVPSRSLVDLASDLDQPNLQLGKRLRYSIPSDTMLLGTGRQSQGESLELGLDNLLLLS